MTKSDVPHSLESEQACLAAPLIDPPLVEVLLEHLTESDFFDSRNRKIIKALEALALNGGAIDRVTLLGKLEELGGGDVGVGYIESLELNLPDLSHLKDYIATVKDRSRRRAAIKAAERTKQRAESPAVTTVELLTEWRDTAESLEAGVKPLQVVTLDELLAEEMQPREPLLEPWLKRKDLSMFYAWRATGKTVVGVGIATAVASGGRFLSWQAPTPRRVLYVDAELPKEDLQERFALAVQASDKTPEPGMVKILTPDKQHAGIPSLLTPENQARVEAHAQDCDLVILDHKSALFPGVEENSAESAAPVSQFLMRLRRKGKATILFHHSGKGGLQRGTSANEDILDSSVKLVHPADYVITQGARFEVHFEKIRGRSSWSRPFEAWLQTDPHGKPVWTLRDLEVTIHQQVVELHRQGLSQREIGRKLGRHASTVNRHIRDARKAGDL